MIVQGRPDLGLQAHQQQAYKAVTDAFEKSNKASVVIPTGCGKSFISLQLMEDNRDKDMLFIAPTNAIKSQMYSYIAKYVAGEENRGTKNDVMLAREHFPHLKIILYQSLLRMDEKILNKLHPDIIMMDELHRTGAPLWGEKVNRLLDNNPEAKVLGLTATPDRMDDVNVVDKLFEGNISYELTLVDAIRRGIVKPPEYVKCDYTLRDELESIQQMINDCQDDSTKKELQERYDKMRKIVDNADGIPEVFSKNMKNKSGKYIVFCKDSEHMAQMMTKTKEWFGEIDEEPEVYQVLSKNGEIKNKKEIETFTESKSEHLKLLYSVDMLNEGLHLEDISGVIMLRPTDSRIIYLQQLGRALSSDTSREQTMVFDIVNNYTRINLDREINERPEKANTEEKVDDIEEKEKRDEFNWQHEDIDTFRIQGETKEFFDLLQEVYEINGRSNYLINARAIEAWVGDGTKLPSPTSKDQEERKLGVGLSSIRQKLLKPYMILETDEERAEYREKHPELEEVMKIVEKIDIKCGKKKQAELDILVEKDKKVTERLKEAKKLEQSYKIVYPNNRRNVGAYYE